MAEQEQVDWWCCAIVVAVACKLSLAFDSFALPAADMAVDNTCQSSVTCGIPLLLCLGKGTLAALQSSPRHCRAPHTRRLRALTG